MLCCCSLTGTLLARMAVSMHPTWQATLQGNTTYRARPPRPSHVLPLVSLQVPVSAPPLLTHPEWLVTRRDIQHLCKAGMNDMLPHFLLLNLLCLPLVFLQVPLSSALSCCVSWQATGRL